MRRFLLPRRNILKRRPVLGSILNIKSNDSPRSVSINQSEIACTGKLNVVDFSFNFKLCCIICCRSSDSVTQIEEELANARQGAEKLSIENESLSKNYEALLKARVFI